MEKLWEFFIENFCGRQVAKKKLEISILLNILWKFFIDLKVNRIFVKFYQKFKSLLVKFHKVFAGFYRWTLRDKLIKFFIQILLKNLWSTWMTSIESNTAMKNSQNCLKNYFYDSKLKYGTAKPLNSISMKNFHSICISNNKK